MSTRKVEIPGELHNGDIAFAFGITISDEDREKYRTALEAIDEAERAAHEILLTRLGIGIITTNQEIRTEYLRV